MVAEYADKAISGRTDKRPDFQRMLKDSEKGAFQLLICWKMDRFARNRYDSAIYKAKLKKAGVRVRTGEKDGKKARISVKSGKAL